MITLEGIVLKERLVGEQDKFVDVLTREKGIVEIAVKGAKRLSGRSGSSTQLFAYSRFCINLRREQFYLDSCEPIRIFYGLREELSRISLASYFADVLKYAINEDEDCGEVLRLMLNSLHFLEKGLRPEAMLKSIFELRLMSEIGFMPDIMGCQACGEPEPEELFFCLSDGGYFCTGCFGGDASNNYYKVRMPVLQAIRYIVLADWDRLFSFRVTDSVQKRLSAVSEAYLKTHLERGFKTLDFYKSVSGT